MENTPADRGYRVVAGITTAFWLALTYSISLTIWGFALAKSWQLFALIGAVLGLLIGLLSGTVVGRQLSQERAREMGFAAFGIFVPLAIIIAVVGAIALAVRLIFFH